MKIVKLHLELVLYGTAHVDWLADNVFQLSLQRLIQSN